MSPTPQPGPDEEREAHMNWLSVATWLRSTFGPIFRAEPSIEISPDGSFEAQFADCVITANKAAGLALRPFFATLTTRAERSEADWDGARSEYQRLRGVNRALLEDFDRVVKARDAALAEIARLRAENAGLREAHANFDSRLNQYPIGTKLGITRILMLLDGCFRAALSSEPKEKE